MKNNRTMKRMNKDFSATGLVESSFMLPENNDPLIGCIVKFNPPRNKEEAIRMGKLRQTELYEIVGRQRCYGYDDQGRYGMVDGYRLMCLGFYDQFGCPATNDEFTVITTQN